MPRKKQEKPIEPVEPKVVDSTLEDIVADRFSRYSKYIIQDRALPDARDGLKPVQRRILWAMEEDGNTFEKPYRKSAKTVGNVIGNYHPHGDTSVYDAIVRMSQDWKSSLPLIDMQGNNGSIDDDPPAAMRYTEARLSKIAGYLMEDIDRETVDWSPNFSDDKLEPTVLPARFPNLLIGGITGIAAGYATSIPPHNFNEVLAATIYRIDHPHSTTEQLMEYVPGPDFPTGGIVMGKSGIYDALNTGRGKVVVRSRAEIVTTRTITQIVITEIPYEVVKSALVKRIDELRLNNKIPGILDVRDESDRKGLRIVCDLKKEANPDAILNYLYKNTDLQVNYHYNVIAIVNRSPKQLSLGQMLDAFISHREEVVIKRSKFDLKKKKDRLHIVEGLIKMISVLDEIIKIIRSSSSKAESRAGIMERFGFSQAQAEAIVTLQLYRLSNTDVLALQNEAKELEAAIVELEAILNDPKKRKSLMKKELRALSKEVKVERHTLIQPKIEEIVLNESDMIVEETVVPVVSQQGYFKRVSLRSFASSDQNSPALKEGDLIRFCDQASTLDALVFFTDRGRYGMLPVYTLEEKKWKDLGTHYSSFFKTEPGEKIISMFAMPSRVENTDLVFATKAGQVLRFPAEQLKAGRGKRLNTVVSLSEGDQVVSVAASQDEKDEVILITRYGRGARMKTSLLPLAKSKIRGRRGILIQNEDELLCALIAGRQEIVVENEKGELKRYKPTDFKISDKAIAGTKLYPQLKTAPVALLDARALKEGEDLRLALPSMPIVHASKIGRTTCSAGFDPSVRVDEPALFAPKSLRLSNGSRDRSHNDSPLVQETLFDL